MPEFQYRAVTRDGSLVRGVHEASTQDDATTQLQLNGQTLLSLTAQSGMSWRTSLLTKLSSDVGFSKRVTAQTMARLIGRLASLLEASLPVEQALSILANAESEKAVHHTLSSLLRRLRSGSRLADAMEQDRQTFSPLTIAMVRAGEANGALAQSLSGLSDYLTQAEKTRQTIRSALIYPMILMLTATGSILLVLLVVLPQLEPMFADSAANLPLSTRIAFAISRGLREYWFELLIGTGALSIAFVAALRRPATRLRRDQLMLRVPVLGLTILRLETSRFSRSLGALVAGGVALPTAMALALPVLSNRVMAKALSGATMQVREGRSLSDALVAAAILPAIAIDMIRIGEKTGFLDRMLSRLASLLDSDVEIVLTRSLALLVPILTVVLGIVVAAIIMSVMMAVLSVNEMAH